MATLFTMVPPEKEDLSEKEKKSMKIGAFVQKLSINKHKMHI